MYYKYPKHKSIYSYTILILKHSNFYFLFQNKMLNTDMGTTLRTTPIASLEIWFLLDEEAIIICAAGQN